MSKRRVATNAEFEWFVMRYAALIGEDAFRDIVTLIRDFFKEADRTALKKGDGYIFSRKMLETLQVNPGVKIVLEPERNLSNRLEKTELSVKRLRGNKGTLEPHSLNLALTAEDDFELIDTLTSPDNQVESDRQSSFRKLVETLISSEILTVKEKRVLQLRFAINGSREHTLEEISVMFGITRERVRQIEAAAMVKARNFYSKVNVSQSVLGD